MILHYGFVINNFFLCSILLGISHEPGSSIPLGIASSASFIPPGIGSCGASVPISPVKASLKAQPERLREIVLPTNPFSVMPVMGEPVATPGACRKKRTSAYGNEVERSAAQRKVWEKGLVGRR